MDITEFVWVQESTSLRIKYWFLAFGKIDHINNKWFLVNTTSCWLSNWSKIDCCYGLMFKGLSRETCLSVCACVSWHKPRSWRQRSGLRRTRWWRRWCGHRRHWCWPAGCSSLRGRRDTCTLMTDTQSVWGREAQEKLDEDLELRCYLVSFSSDTLLGAFTSSVAQQRAATPRLKDESNFSPFIITFDSSEGQKGMKTPLRDTFVWEQKAYRVRKVRLLSLLFFFTIYFHF